jgi:hypothetical protein
MAHTQVSHNYSVPKQAVFDVFTDIGNVQDTRPGIELSRRLNQTERTHRGNRDGGHLIRSKALAQQ